MNRCYCAKCERFYSASEVDKCPYCGASVEWQEMDDNEEADIWEPDEEDIEAMYEDYIARFIDDCEIRGKEGAD